MAIADHLADPLERRAIARAVVSLSLLVTICMLAISLGSAAPRQLPGIALGSPLLLHLERAVFVGGAMAGVSTFVVRGWAGRFPLKISTAGVEYPAQSAASETAGHADLVHAAVERIEAKQLVLAESLREDVLMLEKRLTQQI